MCDVTIGEFGTINGESVKSFTLKSSEVCNMVDSRFGEIFSAKLSIYSP